MRPQEPIRLLLVDSPTLHRRSLAAILNRRRNLRVVGEAGTAAEAIDVAGTLHPEVAVVEPRVPGGGISLVADLCRVEPACSVLVVTNSSDDGEARHALQAGARGYLDKEREPDDLVRTIERVHAGELVVSPGAASTVLKHFSGGPSDGAGSGGLTLRELEVLRLVVQGRTNPQIAQELCITEHTVKAHLTKILGKCGLENRVQLVAYALQQGIARPSDSSSPVSS